MSADSNPARSAAAEADYIAAETRRLRGYSATNSGTPLSRAQESVQRTREALARNAGTLTEQDWREALVRAEARVEELEHAAVDAAPTAADNGLEVKARELGLAAGYSAGSRYFGGNADEATYRRVLEGIYGGDPATYDTFPDAPSSGQAPGQQSTYEEAYYAALVHEISERAAYMLSDDAKAR